MAQKRIAGFGSGRGYTAAAAVMGAGFYVVIVGNADYRHDGIHVPGHHSLACASLVTLSLLVAISTHLVTAANGVSSSGVACLDGVVFYVVVYLLLLYSCTTGARL